MPHHFVPAPHPQDKAGTRQLREQQWVTRPHERRQAGSHQATQQREQQWVTRPGVRPQAGSHQAGTRNSHPVRERARRRASAAVELFIDII